MLTLAKKEIEKEREFLMSKSLPGLDEQSTENNDTDSESDTESDDKSRLIAIFHPPKITF